MSKAKDPKKGAAKKTRRTTRASAAKEPKAAKPENAAEEELVENENIEIEIEIESETGADEDQADADRSSHRHRRRNRNRNRNDFPFGPDGIFGPDGPLGPNGPLGASGLFGKSGPFGKAGVFGLKMKPAKGRRGHKRARRGRMFESSELRLVLLGLIAEEPRHGYDCIKALEEASHGSYAPSPGVVYPMLAMMVDEGLIVEQDGDSSRKVYEATEAGHAELEERGDEIAPLLDRIGKRAKRARAARSSDIMRSVGNLASVLANRAARGEMTGEAKDQAIDLIDELARKIERL